MNRHLRVLNNHFLWHQKAACARAGLYWYCPENSVVEMCVLFFKIQTLLKRQTSKQAFILLNTIQTMTWEKLLFWTHNSKLTSFELVENISSFLEMSALLNVLLLDFCITHSLRIWNYGKKFYFKGIYYQHNFCWNVSTGFNGVLVLV